MNNIKAIATAILLFAGTAATYAQAKTETIKVAGNCGMCEKTIEGAAKKAGASKAHWNPDTKILSVTYDSKKTNSDAIQQKIAATGYDTENYVGDETAYKSLHECCQYDGKKTASK